jgi:GNAT superfamily N-acetyltransferase
MSTIGAGAGLIHHETKTSQNDPLEGVPALSTYIATEPDDVVPALKLVADSVAQQRQIAARILIFHPLNWAVMVAVFAGIYQWLYKSSSDLPLLFTTGAGAVMAGFAAVKWLSSGYIEHAESINWNWLVADDQVLITKFGDEIIGTCIVGWEKGEGRGNRRKTWGRGVIKGWAVRMRYRGKGVGSALLEEAVKVVEKKGGDEIIFADDHASTFLGSTFPAVILLGVSLLTSISHRFQTRPPTNIQLSARQERRKIQSSTPGSRLKNTQLCKEEVVRFLTSCSSDVFRSYIDMRFG